MRMNLDLARIPPDEDEILETCGPFDICQGRYGPYAIHHTEGYEPQDWSLHVARRDEYAKLRCGCLLGPGMRFVVDEGPIGEVFCVPCWANELAGEEEPGD
jgi:hypothetical protein